MNLLDNGNGVFGSGRMRRAQQVIEFIPVTTVPDCCNGKTGSVAPDRVTTFINFYDRLREGSGQHKNLSTKFSSLVNPRFLKLRQTKGVTFNYLKFNPKFYTIVTTIYIRYTWASFIFYSYQVSVF